MYRLELGNGFGPDELVAVVLHRLELDPLLSNVFFGLAEKICVRDISWKDEVRRNGNQACQASFENEEIRPDKKTARRLDLKHGIRKQPAKRRCNHRSAIEDCYARRDLCSCVPFAQVEDHTASAWVSISYQMTSMRGRLTTRGIQTRILQQ